MLQLMSRQRGQPKKGVSIPARSEWSAEHARQEKRVSLLQRTIDDQDEDIAKNNEQTAEIAATFPDVAQLVGVKPTRYFGNRKAFLTIGEAKRLIILGQNPSPKRSIGINIDRLKKFLKDLAMGYLDLLHILPPPMGCLLARLLCLVANFYLDLH